MIYVREHSEAGPSVIVLHGGPAAAGDAAGLAQGLANTFRVLEPWQRGSGDGTLTVAGHVADLHEMIEQLCPGERPALVGHSWGAMLALAYAAEHPDRAGPLALVACGTFDPASRAELDRVFESRLTDELRREVKSLPKRVRSPNERLRRKYALLEPLFLFDPIDDGEPDDAPPLDVRAHLQTWADMTRLQAQGVYPAAFAAIRSAVLMLHGACDPHPGRMIRASLAPYLPQLQYREWDKCGHKPWVERRVREEFFAVLREWLARRLSP
jgi:pimeloyl-ACP methyl ester carboxylesterase